MAYLDFTWWLYMIYIIFHLLTVIILYVIFLYRNRLSLENKIILLSQENNKAKPTIFTSTIFNRFKEMASVDHDNNPSPKDWAILEEMICESYPSFVNGVFSFHYSFSAIEYRVTLLVKLRFTVSEIAKLTCHSKEAISSIRRRLCQRLLKEELPEPRKWDIFVHSL